MPTIQQRNAGMVNLLRADFQHRWEPNFALLGATGAGLLLPQLRGWWPTSSMAANGYVQDQSGQGHELANNQVVTPGIYNLWPYVDFVSASSQYLSRAREADLSSSGGMTIGGWFYFDAPSMGTDAILMAKWESGTDNREYRLWKDDANLPTFAISTAGTGATVVTVAGATALTVSTWYFIVGRADAVTKSIDLFVNDVATARATLTEYNQAVASAIPFSSTADFNVGADENGTADFFDGRATLLHLCCAAAAGAPVASDVIVWNLFEATRAGFGL